MARRTATIIIEPHLLVREALESLIENYRYRVVRSVGSTADIRNPPKMGDGLKLVILGAQSTDDAITEAVRIRKLWPDSKIVLLFEHASIADFQKLLTSEIDGCVPLFASPETLVRTLDLVTIEGARVVVTSGMRQAAIQPTEEDEPCRPQVETYDSLSGNIGHETILRRRVAGKLISTPWHGVHTYSPCAAYERNASQHSYPGASAPRSRALLHFHQPRATDRRACR